MLKVLMPFSSNLLCCCCVHKVFQPKQFLVKMIYGSILPLVVDLIVFTDKGIKLGS